MTYGYCPECGRPGVQRERSPTGDTICSAGHQMKSVEWDRLQHNMLKPVTLDEAVRQIEQYEIELARVRGQVEGLAVSEGSPRMEALRIAADLVRASPDHSAVVNWETTEYLADKILGWLEK